MTRKFRYDPATDTVVETGVPLKPRKAGAWAKPKHCEALAVEPEHVPFERELDRQQGLNVDYDRNGCPVFTGPAQYAKYVAAKGYKNKTSGKGHHAIDPVLLTRVLERAKNG